MIVECDVLQALCRVCLLNVYAYLMGWQSCLILFKGHITPKRINDKYSNDFTTSTPYTYFFLGVVNFVDSPTGELLDSIRDFSNMFELSYLQQICDNVDNDEEFLNPSIGTYVCDLTGQKMKDLFFNKQQAEPDVQFVFGGRHTG